jgi:hypothetical protein
MCAASRSLRSDAPTPQTGPCRPPLEKKKTGGRCQHRHFVLRSRTARCFELALGSRVLVCSDRCALMKLTTAQLDRACGVLLTTAAGDALGAAYEFGPPRRPDLEVAMVGGGSFG